MNVSIVVAGEVVDAVKYNIIFEFDTRSFYKQIVYKSHVYLTLPKNEGIFNEGNNLKVEVKVCRKSNSDLVRSFSTQNLM